MTNPGPYIAAGLTRGQASQLILLKELNAISEATAVCINGRRGEELSSITLIAVLKPRGLVHVGSRPPGDNMVRGRSIYWLTDQGYTVADLLTRDLEPISSAPRRLPLRQQS